MGNTPVSVFTIHSSIYWLIIRGNEQPRKRASAENILPLFSVISKGLYFVRFAACATGISSILHYITAIL